ncbi:hypothetical protein [Chondromyces crocatus]|uniref:Uncharacterized protein n=1 Tax=Chondromyces crocatus TaxID=52 RepID=A0A0K1ERZ1_CHOCO|nr:hypothetical protein [Chondromyces crocatus]AKT43621.1 uncharacterized protein CMC5_078560 [Chondromyces crocatus]
MNLSKKLAILAIAAAPMTMSGTAAAHDLHGCGIHNHGAVISAIAGVALETAELMVLGDIQADQICLVNIADSLNGSLLELIGLRQVVAGHNVQIGALQSVLSEVLIIGSGGSAVSVAEILSENHISVHDVLSVKVAPQTLVLFYLPQAQAQGCGL